MLSASLVSRAARRRCAAWLQLTSGPSAARVGARGVLRDQPRSQVRWGTKVPHYYTWPLRPPLLTAARGPWKDHVPSKLLVAQQVVLDGSSSSG